MISSFPEFVFIFLFLNDLSQAPFPFEVRSLAQRLRDVEFPLFLLKSSSQAFKCSPEIESRLSELRPVISETSAETIDMATAGTARATTVNDKTNRSQILTQPENNLLIQKFNKSSCIEILTLGFESKLNDEDVLSLIMMNDDDDDDVGQKPSLQGKKEL